MGRRRDPIAPVGIEGFERVEEVPEKGTGRGGRRAARGWDATVMAFAASGLGHARHECGSAQEALRVCTALRSAARRTGLPVRVVQRGRCAYMSREGA